ncbi:MAG TPA: hypothetical protein VG943_10955 [Caulobacterales bacterium]|nr:hypothetical protein [Caulobacterales bacterium]
MRRLTTTLLAALLGFSAPHGSAFAATREQQRGWRETRAMCPALRDIDFERLGASWDERSLHEARQALRATDQPQLGDADIVLRFYAPPGFGGGESTWVTARRVGGAWRIAREDRRLEPAAPEPPSLSVHSIDMRAQRSRAPMITREGPLEAERAARIESALADPCLAREPDAAPAVLPLRGGHDEPCYDGAPFFLQIERAEGVRTLLHVCETRWRAGDIMRALESAQGEVGQTTVTHGLTPRVFVDDQNHDIPNAVDAPPKRLSFSGDYAGRMITVRVAGQEIFNATQPADAPPLAFLLWPPLDANPAPLEVVLENCPPFRAALSQEASTLAVQGCRLSLR